MLCYNYFMKKILFLVLVLFTLSCYAVDNLSFIYINGSNNNDPKMKNWYTGGVKKLHPVLRKKILKNNQIKKYYASLGGLDIKKEPIIFFWGYNSKDDLNFVKSQLQISKMVSSSGAYIVRNLITKFLHDAIWVQKPHNMLPILDELNEKVKQEANEGNSVVLYGYSAGTFVAYEYLFNKLRYINLEKLFNELNPNKDLIKFVINNPKNNTCISAIVNENNGIGTLTSKGNLILNSNLQILKANYLKLDDLTEKYCAPENKVMGAVNFASPLVLFYSDMSDKNYELNYYNKLMIKHILENGIFLLTANFKEDPLGFPTGRNMTIEDIENRLELKIENPNGVIYDSSGIWSKRMFPFAHTAYWSAKGTFSRAIVNNFINGYKFLYDKKYQRKVLKRNNKKSEL